MRHFRSKWQKCQNWKKTCQMTEYIDIALSDLGLICLRNVPLQEIYSQTWMIWRQKQVEQSLWGRGDDRSRHFTPDRQRWLPLLSQRVNLLLIVISSRSLFDFELSSSYWYWTNVISFLIRLEGKRWGWTQRNDVHAKMIRCILDFWTDIHN